MSTSLDDSKAVKGSIMHQIVRALPAGRYREAALQLQRQEYEPNSSDTIALAAYHVSMGMRYVVGVAIGSAASFAVIRLSRRPSAPPLLATVVQKFKPFTIYTVAGLAGGMISQSADRKLSVRALMLAESPLGDSVRAVARDLDPGLTPLELPKDVAKPKKELDSDPYSTSGARKTTISPRDEDVATHDPYASAPARTRSRVDDNLEPPSGRRPARRSDDDMDTTRPRRRVDDNIEPRSGRRRRGPVDDDDDDADDDDRGDNANGHSYDGEKRSAGRGARTFGRDDDDARTAEEENRRWGAATGSGRRMRSPEEEERSRRHM